MPPPSSLTLDLSLPASVSPAVRAAVEGSIFHTASRSARIAARCSAFCDSFAEPGLPMPKADVAKPKLIFFRNGVSSRSASGGAAVGAAAEHEEPARGEEGDPEETEGGRLLGCISCRRNVSSSLVTGKLDCAPSFLVERVPAACAHRSEC